MELYWRSKYSKKEVDKIIFLKLAIVNVKRNRKVYNTYFISLATGIELFYMLLLLVSSVTKSIGDIGSRTIVYIGIATVSVITLIVLSFMFQYINTFIIKRRSREMSIYLLLGMSTDEVATVLLYEVLIISSLSLISGCVAGGLISLAGISLLQSELNLDTKISFFSVNVQLSVLAKTILLYIFLVICNINKNTKTIQKTSIINLINKDRVNDVEQDVDVKIKLMLFICSIFLIVYAGSIGKTLMTESASLKLVSEITAGIVGCFWFYWGLTGVLAKICTYLKRFYYHKYNSYIINQMKKNMSMHYKSMAVVSLGLLISICCFAFAAFFLSNYYESLAEKCSYSATLWFNEEDDSAEDTIIYIQDKFSNSIKCCLIHRFCCEEESLPEKFVENGFDYIVSISDYNKAMKIQGKEEIVLNQYEYALCSRYVENDDNKNLYYEELTINNITLKPYKKELLRSNIYNSLRGNNIIIVSDELLSEYKNSLLNKETFVNIVYKKSLPISQVEQLYSQIQENTKADIIDETEVKKMFKLDIFTGIEIITFLGLGIVFIFFACTILGMHSITELYDGMKSYRILKLLGCTRKKMNRIILVHLSIIYIIPFAITCSVMIQVLNGLFEDSYNMEKYIYLTVAIFSAFYLFYFVLTLIKSFHMIKQHIFQQ